jgi:hypothetical protein
MKAMRLAYLVMVMALACAQMFVTLSPWTAPAFTAGSHGTLVLVWFVALFAAWIVAMAADLVLSVMGTLPLSFAMVAILCNVSLAVLLVLDGGFFYILCALAAPIVILVKAVEEMAGHGAQLKTA